MAGKAKSIVMVAMLFALVAAHSASAAVFYVDDSVTTDPVFQDGLTTATAFDNITSAVVAAVNGDELRVAGGTYQEGAQLDITESLTFLGGWNGGFTARDPAANVTTIDGQLLSRCIWVHTAVASFTFDGVSLINGIGGPSTGGADRGGCMHIEDGATGRFIDCRIADNQCPGNGRADDGAAIFLRDNNTSVTFVRCVVEGNFVADTGIVRSDDTSYLTLTDCIVRNNLGDNLGGNNFLMRTNGPSTFTNCLFTGNRDLVAFAEHTGPAGARTVRYVNCTIADNPMTERFIRLANADLSFFCDNTIFADNNSGGPGDMLIHEDVAPTTAVVTYSLAWNNNAPGGLGPNFVIGANNNIAADPDFISSRFGNYRLGGLSAAAEAGNTAAAPAADLEGNARPNGAAADIGAYEQPDILYVDQSDPTPPGAGTLADPFNTITSATAAAVPVGQVILVAAGTYPEVRRVEIPEGAQILGGYASGFATRDIAANIVAIDGGGAHQCVVSNGTHGWLLDGVTLQNGITGPTAEPIEGGKGAALRVNNGGTGTFSNSKVTNCVATGAGATHNRGIIHTIGTSSATNTYLIVDKVDVSNCTIAGQGIINNETQTNLIVMNSTVTNCTANGGRVLETSSNGRDVFFINCQFFNNRATGTNRFMDFKAFNPALVNCTFTSNSAGNHFIQITNGNADYRILNNVFADNTVTGNNQLINRSNGRSVTIANNVVWNNTVGGGTGVLLVGRFGNVSGDPMFVNQAAGDLHLGPGSAAVDAGQNVSTVQTRQDGTFVFTTDLEGVARPQMAAQDAGCYEVTEALTTARSFDQAEYTWGVPLTATITATPVNPAAQITVEELLPEGLTSASISGITGGGVLSSTGISWTLAPFNAATSVSYTVTVPEAAIIGWDFLHLPLNFLGSVVDGRGHVNALPFRSVKHQGTIVLQEGVHPTAGYGDSQDAHILVASANNNTGIDDRIEEGANAAGLANHRKIVVRFNGTAGDLPPTSATEVTRAVVRLYATGVRVSAATPHLLAAAQILKDWNEGSGPLWNGTGTVDDGYNVTTGPVTWNDAEKNLAPWALAGAMATTDVLSAASPTAWDAVVPAWVNVDVTGSMPAMMTTPAENLGWKISQDSLEGVPYNTAGNEYVDGIYQFVSSNSSEAEQRFRPLLLIETADLVPIEVSRFKAD